ncbi:MAG: L-threonylcarbamoyladenylate synthase [Armatimonadota bacterium]|nr:L-threonylcarbamoyladenylate synthase [Armatimonadota bacterium]MDR7451130.1 L-threonylcarbamoyladenylate synthase [Armatimonadota bacterium]MDR7467265.1 L-threonylcarbamoyladenylate synthase [Armatimonadota bacterium]MDR7494526.1 L-threonylcarbamoyladenylate synthase [Armatimonadota bacterium]MDR7499897.1 L-threonylcarbamoyladenylate synthase [Armatimonadota bacterium]
MSYYGLTFANVGDLTPRPLPIIRVEPHERRAPRRALEVLRRGGVIVYPTDTVYGLGCRIDDEGAVRRIISLKGRGLDDPLPVLLADPAQLEEYGTAVSAAARRLAALYWPGPLTIVVRRSARIPAFVTGGGETVGLRVPGHPMPRALVRDLGVPIVGTSANTHGAPAPVTAQGAVFELGDRVDLVIDGGRVPLGLPSTVVDATADPPRLIRQGAVVLRDVAA